METLESIKYASLKEHQELVEVFLKQCQLVNGLMHEIMYPPIAVAEMEPLSERQRQWIYDGVQVNPTST